MVLHCAAQHRLHGEPRSGQGRQPPARRRVIKLRGGSDAVARLASPRLLRSDLAEHTRDNEQARLHCRGPSRLSPHGHHTRGEDRMMLWLLVTLSVVTISWGIAHRLKAVDPAANCTR